MHTIYADHNGGLGIEQNVVCLCVKCHNDFDNGKYREEYGTKIEKYLKRKYDNWSKEAVSYTKK